MKNWRNKEQKHKIQQHEKLHREKDLGFEGFVVKGPRREEITQ